MTTTSTRELVGELMAADPIVVRADAPLAEAAGRSWIATTSAACRSWTAPATLVGVCQPDRPRPRPGDRVPLGRAGRASRSAT